VKPTSRPAGRVDVLLPAVRSIIFDNSYQEEKRKQKKRERKFYVETIPYLGVVSLLGQYARGCEHGDGCSR
jgi:hypothetical protein